MNQSELEAITCNRDQVLGGKIGFGSVPHWSRKWREFR